LGKVTILILILEYSVGSGIVINSLQVMMEKEGIKSVYMATDINSKALEAA